MSELLRSLENANDAVWALWKQAVTTPGHAAALFAFATQRESGGPAARMVVLRDVSKELHTLTVWTNAASMKTQELAKSPYAEALFWLPETQEQIRASLRIEQDTGNPEVWASLGNGSKQNYSAHPTPGSRLNSPEDYNPEPKREQFVVLTAHVEALDVLSLGHSPHRRAVIDKDGPRWVAP